MINEVSTCISVQKIVIVRLYNYPAQNIHHLHAPHILVNH